MYIIIVTNVIAYDGESNTFSIKIWLHQWLILSLYIFTLVMDEVTKDIRRHPLGGMLFADDVVLNDESRIRVDHKLELWRRTLESKCFRLGMTKIEYWGINSVMTDGGDVRLDGQVVPMKDTFWYLWLILQSDGGIEEDVSRMREMVTSIWHFLWQFFLNKLKGKFYKTMIRLTMMYGAECLAIKW
jgi:hypothetical protein